MRRSGEVVLARQAGGRGRGRAGARRQAGGWMSLTMSQGSEGGAGGGIYARFNEGRPCRECVFVLVRCMPRAAQRPHPCSLAASFPVAGHLYLSATSYGPLAAARWSPHPTPQSVVTQCPAQSCRALPSMLVAAWPWACAAYGCARRVHVWCPHGGRPRRLPRTVGTTHCM